MQFFWFQLDFHMDLQLAVGQFADLGQTLTCLGVRWEAQALLCVFFHLTGD